MPFPKSYEEIVAELTPTPKEKEFHDWFHENVSKQFSLSIEEMGKSLGDRWPNPEDLNDYHDWCDKWLSVRRENAYSTITQEEFFQKTLDTNFADAKSREYWWWMMEMWNTPTCLLGESDFGGIFTGYALEPRSNYLTAHVGPEEARADLLVCTFLGISTDVKIKPVFHPLPDSTTSPKKRGRGGDSEDSNDSKDSGYASLDDQPHGFVFAQLGALYYCKSQKPWSEIRDQTQDQIAEQPWEQTGYGVVLELSPHGAPLGVWVLYNFYDYDEDTGDLNAFPTHDRNTREYLPHVARLQPASDACFTVAKIADSLQEFNPRNVIDFRHRETHNCQIVRVKQESDQKELFRDVPAPNPSYPPEDEHMA